MLKCYNEPVDIYAKFMWATIGAILLISPIIYALLERHRQRLFGALAEEYGLRYTLCQIPPWSFYFGGQAIPLRQLSGQLAGKAIVLSDVLTTGWQLGFFGLRYFFYFQSSWGLRTELSVDGVDIPLRRLNALSSARSIRRKLDGFTTTGSS
ncbi:hypothetical protein XH90_03480 [Bradyrhizobium sp. CCBAU 53338]|nr:hypothetical protein XH90_03480 [Bradyrhizobium sp. CCBAU 53338]